jgi:hypothetical protein
LKKRKTRELFILTGLSLNDVINTEYTSDIMGGLKNTDESR